MRKVPFRKRFYDLLVCLALLAAVITLVVFPKQSVDAARDGLTLCLNSIIPSLFPFFVLSTLIVELGLARKFGRVLEPVMRPLFHVGGACSAAFVLGFIGGYPVGAKTVIALYESGNCSKAEAERLLSFCNNSGPAFILGVVGAGVFSSSKIGLLLYFAHTAASICIGILFRNWGGKSTREKKALPAPAQEKRFSLAFTESVKSSFQTVLSICGFVIFFTVLIKLLFLSGLLPLLASLLGSLLAPFGLDEKGAQSLLTGFIELTCGVWTLQGAEGHLTAYIAMASFMLGWAGLSIHSQVLSFIGGSGLRVKTYVIGKSLHAFLSMGFAFILARIFLFDKPVAVYLADQVAGIASLKFAPALLLSSACAVVLWFAFLISAKVRARQLPRGR